MGSGARFELLELLIAQHARVLELAPTRLARGEDEIDFAREKALPFEPLVPNETTIAAMREARVGNVKSFDGVDALMADLHAED